ncbi:MAG: reverse transcriptase domain-containing protein [Dokdonella sp.]|nr:reverse transcriptase domain-containing protein [Dokdonella sp.]
MTTPRYPQGCLAGSQARRDASSPDAEDPDDYAWIVNFHNGNVNLNHRDNNAFVRAVRSVPASECQGAQCNEPVSFRSLHAAWRRARRKKKPSNDQMRFETRWIDNLFELQTRLRAGTWAPSPSTCFIADRPKAREIHAPSFADRVVHHWLVPHLEAIYERIFIADSYSNRRGKGTLAAVKRVHAFARQVRSGQGRGWYLQLDIHNFFPSIHRPTLYGLLRKRMRRAGLPLPVQRCVHALLRRSATETGIRYVCTPAERAKVPRHKRLESARPGCGIPIGNLSSQFFANVYLNELDQFVKHELRAPRYARYVDDFVLIHESREQLIEWLERITTFLAERLHLQLKPDIRLRPLDDGIDFLGYVVRPTHLLPRRRVIAHANAALAAWEREHVHGDHLRAAPADLRALRSTWQSYAGHLRHARTHRLQRRFHRRFPWLSAAGMTRHFRPSSERRIRAIRWRTSARKP